MTLMSEPTTPTVSVPDQAPVAPAVAPPVPEAAQAENRAGFVRRLFTRAGKATGIEVVPPDASSAPVLNEAAEPRITEVPPVFNSALPDTPDSGTTAREAPPAESYPEKTNREVKNKFPNLTISKNFYKENVAILTGGDAGLGGANKVDILNNGEKVSPEWTAKTGEMSQDRAVAFKLREGSQDGKLAFHMDAGGKISIFPDINKIPDMPSEQLAKSLVFYNEGGKLFAMNGHGEITEVQKAMLETGSYTFVMDSKTGAGLELVGWGASLGEGPRTGHTSEDSDLIVVHKAQFAPAPVLPVTPTQASHIRDIILGPLLVGASALSGIGGDTHENVEYSQIANPPPGEYRIPDGPVDTSTIQVPASSEIDDSLKCEKFIPMTVKEGGSLTQLIVDANGVDRYMARGTDGLIRFDVDLLYKDLMCMVANPDNLPQIQKDDPEAASLITAMLEMQKATGHTITSQEMYDAFKDKLNSPERIEGANNQLVWTFAGAEYKVPVREKAVPASRVFTPENPAPPTSGNAGLAAK